MRHNASADLNELRKALWTYTAATGRSDIKEETMDRLFQRVMDACDATAKEYWSK